MKTKIQNKTSRRTFVMMTLVVMLIVMGSTVVLGGTAEDFSHLDITLLNQDPDPAKQGEYLDLRWKVVKEGNNVMGDITFNLEIGYPFFFDSIDVAQKKVGDWYGFSDEDEFYMLHYKVRVHEDALEDEYEVKLRITNDNTASSIVKEFDISVGDKKEPEFVLGTIETSPMKLLSDTEENKLEVTLENIGDENAENVQIELVLVEGITATYGYSTRANLGTISSGDSAVGTFYIDLDEDVKEGAQSTFVHVKYKDASDDENEYKTLQIPLDIPVNGRPDFVIENVKITPAEPQEGDEAEILLTIKNIGSKDAESVSVRSFKESSQPFEFNEKSDFIGKLQPGESGDAILKFVVEKDANAKKYLLDLEIRGIYNNEVLTESEVLPVVVGETIKKGKGLITFIILLVIGVLIVGAITLLRRRNK